MSNAAELFKKVTLQMSAHDLNVMLRIETEKIEQESLRKFNFYLKYPYYASYSYYDSEADSFFEKKAAIDIAMPTILKQLENRDLDYIKDFIKNNDNEFGRKCIIRTMVALIVTHRDLRTDVAEPLMDFLIEMLSDCNVDSDVRSRVSFELQLLLHPQIADEMHISGFLKFYASILSPLSDEIIKKAVSSLIILLRHTDPDIRANAATALQFRKDACVAKTMLELLYDEDVKIKRSAILFFGRQGNAVAVERLIELIYNKNIDIRESAIRSLGEIGDSRAVEPLIELIEDDLGHEMAHTDTNAIRALIMIGNQKAIEFLTNLFKSTDQDKVGSGIARSFSYVGRENKAIIDFFSKYLTDSNLVARWEACWHLAHFKTPKAIPFLMEFQTNPKYAYDVIWMLRVLFKEYSLFEDSLIKALKNGAITTEEAIEALARMEDPYVRNPKAYLQYLLGKSDQNFSYFSFISSEDIAKVSDCCKDNLKIGDEAIAILGENREKKSIHALSCPEVKAAYWS